MNQGRLRDQVDSSDADVGVAAALVESVTRLPPSEQRKQRVWAALSQQRRHRPLRRLRAAFVLGAVVATSAAFASVLPRLLHVLPWRSQSESEPAPAPRAHARISPPPPPAARQVESPEPPTLPPPPQAPAKPHRHVAAPAAAASTQEEA